MSGYPINPSSDPSENDDMRPLTRFLTGLGSSGRELGQGSFQHDRSGNNRMFLPAAGPQSFASSQSSGAGSFSGYSSGDPSSGFGAPQQTHQVPGPGAKPAPAKPARQELHTDYGDHVKVGGNRAWRNNNPGNLKFQKGGFAEKHGATGQDKDGFAIFPTEEAGMAAQNDLWRTPRYQGLTIDQAVERWASDSPAKEKQEYKAKLSRAAGVTQDTRISDLSDEQITRMTAVQRVQEGYRAGQVVKKNQPPAVRK